MWSWSWRHTVSNTNWLRYIYKANSTGNNYIKTIVRQHFSAIFREGLWCITTLHYWAVTFFYILHNGDFINIPAEIHIKPQALNPSILYNKNCKSTCVQVTLWQFLLTSTRCLPSPAAGLVRGGRGDGRGTARLNMLQVAWVAEQVAVERVAPVPLLVVQLHLAVLKHTMMREMRCVGHLHTDKRTTGLTSAPYWPRFCALNVWTAIITSNMYRCRHSREICLCIYKEIWKHLISSWWGTPWSALWLTIWRNMQMAPLRTAW